MIDQDLAVVRTLLVSLGIENAAHMDNTELKECAERLAAKAKSGIPERVRKYCSSSDVYAGRPPVVADKIYEVLGHFYKIWDIEWVSDEQIAIELKTSIERLRPTLYRMTKKGAVKKRKVTQYSI
jgi:hypothetical protein